MWQAKQLQIQNPAGLLQSPAINWLKDTQICGPHREVLFISLTQCILNPKAHVTLGFNPRAQLFLGLQAVLNLTEKILDLTAVDAKEAKIGSIVDPLHVNPDREMQLSSVQKMLRAEVILLMASIAVSQDQLNRNEVMRVFEYLSSVNSQTDEMLPLMVEQVLGPQARSVFEFLTIHIFFHKSSSLHETRHKIYQAESLLSDFLAKMKLPTWEQSQVASVIFHIPTATESGKNAVFIPFGSSNSDVRMTGGFEEACRSSLHDGVTQFFVIETFVERLRWIDRIAARRQVERLAAVRAEPLRMQSFFDARAGRNSFFILSDEGLSILESVLARVDLMNFDMDVQEMIATSIEVAELRKSVSYFKDPQYDLIRLTQTLQDLSSHSEAPSGLADVSGLQRLFQKGEFP